ncbi:MAG: hypothetical protein Q9212_005495 [Teloschistes hypoglaucus]
MTTDIPTRPRVFLDVQSGVEFLGRIVIELFSDKTPKTCENFRSICTSSHTPTSSAKPLTYKDSPFHRIIDEFMIQGGDVTAGNGTGGASIYGRNFEDENLGWRKIDAVGLVCMANIGKATNSSQFFITLAPCEHLDGKHTVFGHVVKGMDVCERMAKVPVDKKDRPLAEVIISHCGELERRSKQGLAAPLRSKEPERERYLKDQHHHGVEEAIPASTKTVVAALPRAPHVRMMTFHSHQQGAVIIGNVALLPHDQDPRCDPSHRTCDAEPLIVIDRLGMAVLNSRIDRAGEITEKEAKDNRTGEETATSLATTANPRTISATNYEGIWC